MPLADSEARILFSSDFFGAMVGGTGGHRRARQLFELLLRAEIPIAIARPVRDTAVAGLRRADWRTVANYARLVHRGPLGRVRVAAGFARNYGDWRRALSQYPQARVLVWEDTVNAHVMRAAKDAGLRVVAVPQNLESLVPGMRDGRTGQGLPWSLEHEIEQLSRADSVYTISREEQWLLRLRGVAADYLPFFPALEEQQRWLALRARRLARGERADRCLVLGSAVNPPTRAGMNELLTWLASHPPASPFPINVIGYGTEVFKGLQNDRIAVLGPLGDDALSDQLLRARAVVLHQSAAVGALIRISEMLLAGVPVLSSAIAARSTSQYEGVTVYDSFADLAPLLDEAERPSPPVPEPPSSFERAFIGTVSKWAQD